MVSENLPWKRSLERSTIKASNKCSSAKFGFSSEVLAVPGNALMSHHSNQNAIGKRINAVLAFTNLVKKLLWIFLGTIAFQANCGFADPEVCILFQAAGPG
jgi:hypothetical protein